MFRVLAALILLCTLSLGLAHAQAPATQTGSPAVPPQGNESFISKWTDKLGITHKPAPPAAVPAAPNAVDDQLIIKAGDTPPCTLKLGPGGTPQLYMPFPASLKHGVNLPNWWDDTQAKPLTSGELKSLHDAGFDFVQLPISPAWLEISDPDKQKQKLDALHCDLISILNEGLSVVLDMHASPQYQAQMTQRPEELTLRIEKFWEKMRAPMSELPLWRIYLSLYSQPLVESVSWWRSQEKIIDDLRPLYPTNTFVASPGPFNGWWDLTDRAPYKDTNVVYDFHFYEPTIFTHHGEKSQIADPSAPPAPIVYPVEKTFAFDMADGPTQQYVQQNWNRASIASIIHNVGLWRDHYSVNAICLEFGVDRRYVDDKSRYAWYKDAHEPMDETNIPWAVADYNGPFGLFDASGAPDKGLMTALSLRPLKPQ